MRPWCAACWRRKVAYRFRTLSDGSKLERRSDRCQWCLTEDRPLRPFGPPLPSPAVEAVPAKPKRYGKDTIKHAHEASLDWTSDPCRRCGKYPLSIFNRTGYCRECSRHHVKSERRHAA